MQRETKDKYNSMLAMMAIAYGVKDAKENFTATVPMAQRLNEAIQESIDFLKLITIMPTRDIMGEVLTMMAHATIASRTDTSDGNERNPQTALAPDGLQYICKQTNFDVAILYSTLDAWARYNFAAMYMNSVYRRIGLDRILIGFYGESAAATTDRVANPYLQDVNIGWIKKLATHKAAHYITEGAVTDIISIGATGDYKNLDAFAYDISSIIPDSHRTGNEVAIIGRELVSQDTGKILAAIGHTPSERNMFQTLEKSYGGVRSYMCPLFPARGLLITDPKNLHIYYQDTSLRRASVDEPKKNRIVDYISMNEAYAIEDYDAIAGVKAANVKFVEELEA